MGKMSKEKGKRGEREVAALLRSHGFVARRGQQHSGSPDSPDVVHDIEGIHLEVKYTERLKVYEAFEQAALDAGRENTPVVFHRRNRKQWLAIMDAEAFLELVEAK